MHARAFATLAQTPQRRGFQPPPGFVTNHSANFIHLPITGPDGVTRQAHYHQVIWIADPLVIAMHEEVDCIYPRPLYAQQDEVGHSHGPLGYTNHTVTIFHEDAPGHICLNQGVEALKDLGLKAELHRFLAIQSEATILKRRITALEEDLANALSRHYLCIQRLMQANIIDWVEDVWEQMMLVGPTPLGQRTTTFQRG